MKIKQNKLRSNNNSKSVNCAGEKSVDFAPSFSEKQ